MDEKEAWLSGVLPVPQIHLSQFSIEFGDGPTIDDYVGLTAQRMRRARAINKKHFDGGKKSRHPQFGSYRILKAVQTVESPQVAESQTDVLSPYRDGTNAYLSSIGMLNDIRNDAVRRYGKDVLKTAARIAYEFGIDEPEVVESLFKPLQGLGEASVRDLVLDLGKDPRSLAEYKTFMKSIAEGVRNVAVLVPRNAGVMLEDVALSKDLPSLMKERRGLSLTYSRNIVMLFDYNPK